MTEAPKTEHKLVKKKRWNTLGFILVSLCLAVSSVIAGVFAFLELYGWNHKEDMDIDPEYAMYIADDAVVSRRYEIAPCDRLLFFDDWPGFRRTLFINAVPKLTVVNDDGYYVEVLTNESMQDALLVETDENVLTITCQDGLYNRVHEDDTEYDYDYGLYVDCTQLEITVHAPIDTFWTGTNLEVDLQMAKADSVWVDFSYEGVTGAISGIDTPNFTLDCSGSSKLTLQGAVHGTADINLWHDSRIDARELEADHWDVWISRAIGGFSYLRARRFPPIDCEPITGPTTGLACVAYIPFVFWVAMEIRLIIKRRKLTRALVQQTQS